MSPPDRPTTRDVRPLLFSRMDRLFLKVSPKRLSAKQTAA